MLSIDANRHEIGRILDGEQRGLVAIVGPCSNQLDDLILGEGIDLSDMRRDSLLPVHRIPPWKPRTPVAEHLPKPWEGLEQTDPDEALARTQYEVDEGVAVALEFGHESHISKFGSLVSLGWIGSRNVGKVSLAKAIKHPATTGLPIGIKNGMHGHIDSAIKQARNVQGLSVPIFRGGDQCKDPESWEQQYLEAIYKTGGSLVVDIAHGGEMAHDPEGNFAKSVLGQIACMEHVIELARCGVIPTGIMIEASDHIYTDPYRATDPNMPFDTALTGISALHDIIMDSR